MLTEELAESSLCKGLASKQLLRCQGHATMQKALPAKQIHSKQCACWQVAMMRLGAH